jgi:hypothetical protein
MKKLILSLTFLFTLGLLSYGQITDPLISNCATNAGANARYLKDFRIQLGKSNGQTELRYKANMSLWKNTRYRFTLCTDDNSIGKLVLNIWDNTNNVVLSSVDKKTGTIFNYVDLVCNKSGVYQIYFDFTEGQSGSGVSIVSMIQ